ncbi:MAG: nicotinate-nucleotide adenylyltransferase [Caldilineaceae bacterium]|nr:nicotinate-nucleotide adenylyltransferase [Caldilineaceae bacterium]
MTKPRIGIFGGTFDPVHIGHLILAEEARFQLALDRVYLVPAGEPPHKQDQPLTAVTHRLIMTELATNEMPGLWVSRVDTDRPGPHYSNDTVALLRAELGEDVDLFFLMGMDSLRDLPTWRQPQWLIEQCTLVVLTRHDIAIDWPQLEEALPGLRARVVLLDMPELEIASRSLRERIRQGAPICHQVPRPVEVYIQKHRLYQM